MKVFVTKKHIQIYAPYIPDYGRKITQLRCRLSAHEILSLRIHSRMLIAT